MPTRSCFQCTQSAHMHVYAQVTHDPPPHERIMTIPTCYEHGFSAFHRANMCKSTYAEEGHISVGYTLTTP